MGVKYSKNDLIRREDARRIIDSPRSKEQMLIMLEDAPAADVEERNAGTWIIYNPEDIGTTNCRCSNCRTEFFFASIPTRPYAYCPACGAKMEDNE